MNKRIGLFTEVTSKKQKAGPRTTDASYVDVAGAPDLVEKLAALGAKKVGLLRKDRNGTTHMEGSMLAPADLNEEHLDWLTAKPAEFETRGVYYAK
jgi:hypothetical protein